MAVSVRRATPDLAGLLTDLAYEAKRHWGYPESLMALWKDSLTLAADFISENPVYTAETDKSILGFYAVVQKDDVASLEHFWIRPEVMGKGIGRILFLHAVRVAKKAECRSLEIVSDPNAEGFYIRMGARRVGFAPSIPEDRQLPSLSMPCSIGAGHHRGVTAGGAWACDRIRRGIPSPSAGRRPAHSFEVNQVTDSQEMETRSGRDVADDHPTEEPKRAD